jgi:hypothetical protein
LGQHRRSLLQPRRPLHRRLSIFQRAPLAARKPWRPHWRGWTSSAAQCATCRSAALETPAFGLAACLRRHCRCVVPFHWNKHCLLPALRIRRARPWFSRLLGGPHTRPSCHTRPPLHPPARRQGLHPLVRRRLAAIDLETGQPRDPPPGFWLRVVARMRLRVPADAMGRAKAGEVRQAWEMYSQQMVGRWGGCRMAGVRAGGSAGGRAVGCAGAHGTCEGRGASRGWRRQAERVIAGRHGGPGCAGVLCPSSCAASSSKGTEDGAARASLSPSPNRRCYPMPGEFAPGQCRLAQFPGSPQ